MPDTALPAGAETLLAAGTAPLVVALPAGVVVGSDVQALHRFVEIGLDGQLGLEPPPRTDYDEQNDAGDDRAPDAEDAADLA